ncbi:MAG: hypothetical protein KDE15_04470, partial [Erythrobacter sp.]|nr:hypothetical protein [Erythrobacter sp.]
PDGEAALREALAQGNPHAAHYLALAWSEQLLTPRTGESALALARAAAPDGGLTAAIDLADAEALAAQDGAELLAVADRLAASPARAIPAVRARIGFWHLLADDEAGGFEQLEQAAASGAPEALLILASGLQLQNRSTSASGQSLRQLLGLAADNGLVSALEQVATIEHDSGNLELAAQLAERAARSGQPHTFNLRDQYSADWRQQQAQAELAQRVIEALQAQPDSRSQSGQPAYTPPPRPRRTARPMANTCDTTGLGPGNDAACGAQATICTTTGLGPGNAAACGGRATICTTTGLGPGNDAACGGLATICTTTGLGPGNDAACGGLATICTTTGLGPGNDAACGGQATICTSTGLGEGNVEACGGRAR